MTRITEVKRVFLSRAEAVTENKRARRILRTATAGLDSRTPVGRRFKGFHANSENSDEVRKNTSQTGCPRPESQHITCQATDRPSSDPLCADANAIAGTETKNSNANIKMQYAMLNNMP